MKDTKSRISGFLGLAFNMTVLLLLVMFLDSFLRKLPPVRADLRLSHYSNRSTHKALRFIPNVDLTPHFTRHTKMVFLYLVCTSGSKQEIVWSRIVRRGDGCLLKAEESSALFVPAPNQPITIELRGNIFPFVGIMTTRDYGRLAVK